MAKGKISPAPLDDMTEDDDDVKEVSKYSLPELLEEALPAERPDAVRPARGASPPPDTPPRGCTTMSGVPPNDPDDPNPLGPPVTNPITDH